MSRDDGHRWHRHHRGVRAHLPVNQQALRSGELAERLVPPLSGMSQEDSEIVMAEADDILAILSSPVRRDIPELDIEVDPRGALAAFWDGYSDGRAGVKRRVSPEYDEPAIYRRAYAAGTKSIRETGTSSA